MVVTISNNKITTMIGGVAEGVAHEVVVGGAMATVEAKVLMISRNHHQVCLCKHNILYILLLFRGKKVSQFSRIALSPQKFFSEYCYLVCLR